MKDYAMDQPSPITQPAASALTVTGVYYDIVVETVPPRLGSYLVAPHGYVGGALLAIIPTTVAQPLGGTTPALQFVFGLTTDAVLHEARVAREAADVAVYKATEAKDRAEQQVGELQAQIATLTQQAADAAELAQALRRDVTAGSAARAEIFEKLQRLEADLAKVRAYFGAKAFDEAVK